MTPHKNKTPRYYKLILIVNDTLRVIRMTIVSDASTWSITCDPN
jgi:hypothetical protein